MVRGIYWLSSALALSFALPAGDVWAQARTAAQSSGHVFVITGLAGFTSRLEGVVQKVRGRGVPLTVSGPGGWSSLAASSIEAYKAGRLRSIVVVGYSAGGGAALGMAGILHRASVPVELIVTVEPVGFTDIPPNVRNVVNYYLPGGVSGAMPRPYSFRGTLKNIAVRTPGLGHWTLARSLEDDVVKLLVSAASRGRSASKPSPAR